MALEGLNTRKDLSHRDKSLAVFTPGDLSWGQSSLGFSLVDFLFGHRN